MNSPPLSSAFWQANTNSIRWLHKEKIFKEAEITINSNGVQQLEGCMASVSPDVLPQDPSKAFA